MSPSDIGRHLMLRLDCSRFLRDTEYADTQYQYLQTIEPLGFCIFNAESDTIADVLKHIRDESTYPIIFAIDAEWGSAMRIRGGYVLPHAMALSRTNDPIAIHDAGAALGRELFALGIDWNFAPVVDINSNPDNPIINIRSFSDDPLKVADYAELYRQGMEITGIITTAKHFPGHGDTSVDSHTSLPIITKSLDEFEKCELIPFRSMIEEGIPSIMTGHIAAPTVARLLGAEFEKVHLPATLSSTLITTLLRERLGFKGVVISDSIEMRSLNGLGLSELQIAEQFLRAGGDIVLMPRDPAAVFDHLMSTAETDDDFHQILEISDQRLQWLSQFRQWIRLNSIADTVDIPDDLPDRIAEAAMTVSGTMRSKPSEIIILTSDESDDRTKAELIISELRQVGIPLSISTPSSSLTLPQNNGTIIILDRPRGKLLEESNDSSIISMITRLINDLPADYHCSGVIYLGNPYLDRFFTSLKPDASIHTYSDSLPSVKAVIRVLQFLLQ